MMITKLLAYEPHFLSSKPLPISIALKLQHEQVLPFKMISDSPRLNFINIAILKKSEANLPPAERRIIQFRLVSSTLKQISLDTL